MDGFQRSIGDEVTNLEDSLAMDMETGRANAYSCFLFAQLKGG